MSDDYREKLYEKTTTPYWTDHCGHGGYLFSFTCCDTDDKLDVYCWDHVDGRQEFCLRFGDEGGDYRSPSGIENILSSAARGFEPYPACLELLRLAGDIRFCVSSKEVSKDG